MFVFNTFSPFCCSVISPVLLCTPLSFVLSLIVFVLLYSLSSPLSPHLSPSSSIYLVYLFSLLFHISSSLWHSLSLYLSRSVILLSLSLSLIQFVSSSQTSQLLRRFFTQRYSLKREQITCSRFVINRFYIRPALRRGEMDAFSRRLIFSLIKGKRTGAGPSAIDHCV